MYTISEQQIEFILNDIRRNGVELEDLQYNLLDHVCCIIEQELEASGDFEQFYFSTIKKFYKHQLREIEEETTTLLINKHYYTMKKMMLISGTAAAAMLSLGIIAKFMHWPGAGMGIVLGIFTLSFIFLPLLFTLKVKERKETKDKVLLAVGSICAISFSLGILFKIMHWPFANMLGFSSVVILLALFLPVYFITGIRNPDSKVNTIVSSIIIIVGCGLFLSLVRSPHGSHRNYVSLTTSYLRNEQLLSNEWQLINATLKNDTVQKTLSSNTEKIVGLCKEIKTYLLESETGLKQIDTTTLATDNLLTETAVGVYVEDNEQIKEKIAALKSELTTLKQGHVILSLMDNDNVKEMRITEALNILVQVEIFALQQEQLGLTK